MHPQPYDVYPDLADEDLYGAWFNKTIAHRRLGMDASPGGYDLTPVNPTDLKALAVGCEFGGTNGYLRGAYAAWRSVDSFGVVSALVKLSSVGVVHHIFTSADEAGDDDYWAFGVNAANQLNVVANIGGVSRSIVGATALVADRWYRVSVMSDGGTWALYVDDARESVTPGGAGNDGSWLFDVPDRDNVCSGALRTNAILEYSHCVIKDLRYRGLTVDTPDDVEREFKLVVPDPSLAFWTEGGMADLSRYRLPLTLWNEPVVGYQMRFDGTNQSVETTAIELTGGAAISFWFNANADEEAVLFNDVPHANRRLVVKTYGSGEMRAGYWQGAVYRAASGVGYQINRWHHVYCSTDADDTCRLWLDGVELTDSVDPSSGNGISLRIGSSSSGSGNFDGKVRDVRMWRADKGEDFGLELNRTLRKFY